jgi:hypothetical protein
VDIDAQGADGVSLYSGALYVGNAPYTLQMPIDSLGYISAEARGGQEAKIVFTSPDMPGESYNLSLKLKMPPPSGQQRVNKARRMYYWAWGATWITAIVAWGASGIYSSQNDVLSRSSNEQFYSSTQAWNYVRIGSLILVGAAATYNFIQLGRYLYKSTEGATPIARQVKK